MAKQLFVNNASTTLAQVLSNVATALSVATGTGSLFPSPSAGHYFLITLESGATREILKVTARSGDNFTVVRAQEGTTAVAWSIGATVELRETAGFLNQVVQNEGSLASTSLLFRVPGSLTASNTLGASAIGIGANPTASGDNSVVIGGGTASGYRGIAIGNQPSSSGADSVAIGGNSIAVANATAIGPSSSADTDSVAIGYVGVASARAVSIGKAATTSNDGVAIGPYAVGGYGVAVGNNANSSVVGGEGCVAVGPYAEVQTVPHSAALGYYAKVRTALPVWQANHAYYHGDLVTNVAGTKVLMMSSWASTVPERTFTSGATEPTWPTTRYVEVADGTDSCGWMYVRDVPGTLPALNNASMAFGRRAGTYISGLAVGDAAKSTGGGVAIAGKSLGDSSIAISGDAKMDYSIAIGSYSVASTSTPSEVGNAAIGYSAEAYGVRYCLAFGPFLTNRIADSHAITGYSLVTKAGGAGADAHVWNAGQENYVVGDQISLTQTAANDLVVFTIPTNSKFFPTEFGFIVTVASGVTVNPQISFGITGNTTSLVAQSAMDKTSVGGRKVFTPQANSGDGVSTAIKASLKVSATATSLSGRFYIKGLLVENQ